jgi:hypothetical protein
VAPEAELLAYKVFSTDVSLVEHTTLPPPLADLTIEQHL